MAATRIPVSASNDKVYYRDGDAAIRWFSPDGRLGDATTVPGSQNTISTFAVSPDNLRIAVVVEDASSAPAVTERLYVEDVAGHQHHADLYSTTSSLDASGTTLWPVGWHHGDLVIELAAACTSGSAAPKEFHVVDPTSGNRLSTVTCPEQPGTLGTWPSPGGDTCVSGRGISIVDWTGKELAGYPDCCAGFESGLSPSGTGFFASGYYGGQAAAFIVSSTGYDDFRYYLPCLWIDDADLLAPNAVIRSDSHPHRALSLTDSGRCAGRLPGAL